MVSLGTEGSVPDGVKAHLLRSEQDPKPVVLMTCGVAGSGKSTLAKAVAATFPSFTRVSIDHIIDSRHGICGVDYPAEKYDEYMLEADDIYESRFRQLLRDGKDVVLDRSFYAKADRDEFKAMAEEAGARWVLVYFKADKELLWKRICERRSRGVNADSALDISQVLLDAYVEGFEVPVGEGEIVIDVEEAARSGS
ncbi:P-loop containing nucleoside triphosphate hydrolase protein [Coniochaeta ligniaria NRRL 30616]|uniref:p-loop containing nucleoside triphosphate hydrolase protein n=1 Tax=Coniochaeta ligniaria NRRL 30616 TaxID=1408157 RepID=A0A1J7I544_9PEZI|nr:P-loop containing nucleoside triphosphate hydrolase protein [Coniochaeta ligniaria NRRL 30616]